VVGKLTYLSFVVFGGRAWLRALWDCFRSINKSRRFSSITPEAVAALRWWEDRLSSSAPIYRPLFVKPDGFLDVFDGKTFRDPWSLPTATGLSSRMLIVTTDACACGFGFYVGEPSAPLYCTSGAFSLDQAAASSNWRECKTIDLALKFVCDNFGHLLRGAFVLFRSDNTSAVALINKCTSKYYQQHQNQMQHNQIQHNQIQNNQIQNNQIQHNPPYFIPETYNKNTNIPLNNNYYNTTNDECSNINTNNTQYLNIPIDTNVVQTSKGDTNAHINDNAPHTEYNAPVNNDLTNPLEQDNVNVPDKYSTLYEDYYDNEPLYMNV
jgi:hypothetical protein